MAKIVIPVPREECPMRTIHVLRSGRNYFIDGIFWGDDEEGVILYLKAKGVSPDNITKALAGVAQAGRYLIEYEALSQPVF
jgi:hypothetical protein